MKRWLIKDEEDFMTVQSRSEITYTGNHFYKSIESYKKYQVD